MNPWVLYSYFEFQADLARHNDLAERLEKQLGPPPVVNWGLSMRGVAERLKCFQRIVSYVSLHEERFWADGFTAERPNEIWVAHPVWQAVHAYFTDPGNQYDAPNPHREQIVTEAKRIQAEAE